MTPTNKQKKFIAIFNAILFSYIWMYITIDIKQSWYKLHSLLTQDIIQVYFFHTKVFLYFSGLISDGIVISSFNDKSVSVGYLTYFLSQFGYKYDFKR